MPDIQKALKNSMISHLHTLTYLQALKYQSVKYDIVPLSPLSKYRLCKFMKVFCSIPRVLYCVVVVCIIIKYHGHLRFSDYLTQREVIWCK